MFIARVIDGISFLRLSLRSIRVEERTIYRTRAVMRSYATSLSSCLMVSSICSWSVEFLVNFLWSDGIFIFDFDISTGFQSPNNVASETIT